MVGGWQERKKNERSKRKQTALFELYHTTNRTMYEHNAILELRKKTRSKKANSGTTEKNLLRFEWAHLID